MLIKSTMIFDGRIKFWVIPLFAIIFMSFCFSSCKKSSEKVEGEERDIAVEQTGLKYDDNLLIRELSSDPQYLNPVLSNDHPSSLVEDLIFESLISIDATKESKFIGRLAERWEITDDKKSITFYLRKDVKWHDGQPFTAEDVKFTFDIAARPDVPSLSLKPTVEILDGIEIKDPYTLTFTFKYPFSPGLNRVGFVYIVPKHRLDEGGIALENQSREGEKVTFATSSFNRNPFGTGPYKFVEWKTTQHITVERNEEYWDKDNFPSIKKVLIKTIPHRTVAFNVLQKGELDVLRSRAIQYLRFQRMESLHNNFKAEKFYEPAYYYLGWNLREDSPFFTDARVRRAMTASLDRESFIEKVHYGLGKVITGPFYFQSWPYNNEIKAIPYNLQEAARLLQEAGWRDSDGDGILDKDGVQFNFELLIPSGSASFAQLASIVQANLKKLSIEVSIRIFEWSVYLERVRKHNFHAFIGGWVLGIDPDPYAIWHSKQVDTGNNYVGYVNKEVDKLIDEGRRTFEKEKRQAIYHKIHEIVNRDQPYTFVYTPMETYILTKRVTNYEISPFGLFDHFPGQLSWKLEPTMAN